MCDREREFDAERFRAVTEAYGADPARWPAEERAMMTVFQAQNPQEASRWLELAAAVDDALAEAAPQAPSRALRARILNQLAGCSGEEEEAALARAGFRARG